MGTNTLNTIKSNGGVLAKLAAGTLADNLQFGKSISQADPNDYNGKNGYSAGDTIYISKPAIMSTNSSFDATSSMQSIQEQKVALALDIISSVPIDLDSQELASTINIKSIYDRAIKPAVIAIATDVEKTMLTRAMYQTSNIVGTAGSTVFDPDTMLSAGQKLNELLAPMDGERYALLSPAAQRSAINARKGFPNASDEVSNQYKRGLMGEADGFVYMANNLLPRLTSGTATGSITVTTTSVAGATTIALTGTGTQTLTAGQTFTVASCNAVHPQTKVDLGYLKQFVISANNTASGGAYTGVALGGEPIYTATSGSLQNITRFPTASDVVTLGAGIGNTASATYTQNIVYHKDAFRMVSVPLVMPEAVELAVQETYKGYTVAIVRAFDVLKRRMITRVDFLGGFCATRPEWACRISS